MDSQRPQKQKRPYEKPTLRVIELAAEEVLGIGCKTAGGKGPIGAPCSSNSCATGYGS